MSEQKNYAYKRILIFISLLAVLLLFGCEPAPFPDLSAIQVTPPPTRTPPPTPTPITPFPTLAAEGDVLEVDEALDGQVTDLIAQLDKIYERLTGIEKFDLNSEIVSQLDESIQLAIAKLREIPKSGGTPAEVESAYADAIAELIELAKVGTAETVLVELSDAGNSMSSAVTEQLADSMQAGNVTGVSDELENLIEKAPSLNDEEVQEVATDLLNAANELTDATQLIGDLLPENSTDLDGEVAQKLAQAAASIEVGQTKGFLERLAEVKAVIDAIAANIQLAQFLSATVEDVEQETRAVRGLRSLLGDGGNVRISSVEIKLLTTKVDQAESADLMPNLSPARDIGPVCVLGTDLNVSCLNEEATDWVIPESLIPFSGRMSAINTCGDRFIIATDAELIYFKDGEANPVGTEGYPFKPPTQIVCNSAGRIWALPSDDLADSPFFFDGEAWTSHPTILQNFVGTYAFDAAWGTKWEVNENSIVKDGEYIDPIPFVSRQVAQSWDIYYSLNWESGIWEIELDENGEMWFSGSALYHLTTNQGWFGYEGKIGPAFTLLSNGFVIGSGPDSGTVRVFDRSATWWELSDWPEDFHPNEMLTDGRGRVWATSESGVLVWNGKEWQFMPPTVTMPIGLAVIGDGLNLAR